MRWSTRGYILSALFVLLAGACTFTLEPRFPANAEEGAVIEVEVAENGYQRFAADETPVFEEDGLPAYGNEFITQGYLYPPGTLSCDADGICNGVLEDGSPEFPDKVLGEWSCWGYHIGDGAHTTTGPMIITNQVFSFGDIPGADTIASIGYELADFYVPVARAVIGGSGEYGMVRGQQLQETIGFDPARGVSLQVEFQLDR